MRPLLPALAFLLAACGTDANSGEAATVETPSTVAAAPDAPRTYTPADARTFCETVASEAFVRDHFDVEASAAVGQSTNPMSCAGHWGAETPGDAGATVYGFDYAITRDSVAARRFFSEMAESEGLAEADIIPGLGDEAAVDRGGLNPTVMVRVGNVVLHGVQTFPTVWRDDIGAHADQIEDRSLAFAEALVGQL